MIAQLAGRFVTLDEDTVVLDVGGVGYAVRASTGAARMAAEQRTSVTLHTYMHVRDDALQLFGFSTVSERKVFEQLLALQGVGPRVALSIVSAFSPQQIQRAADTGDVALFQSISGIGPKVARRIATELRDRLREAAVIVEGDVAAGASEGTSYLDARDALVGLGLSLAQAEAALQQTPDDMPVDERVRQALQVSRA